MIQGFDLNSGKMLLLFMIRGYTETKSFQEDLEFCSRHYFIRHSNENECKSLECMSEVRIEDKKFRSSEYRWCLKAMSLD